MTELWARATLNAYRYLGSAAYPFMGPFLAVRARKGKEDRGRRYERYGYPSAQKPGGPVVWLHAASVGESIAVMPLIEHVRDLGINTVMTTGTVTSAEIVTGRLPPGTFHQYVPLDLRPAVRRFLGHWQPDLAIFAESEIWPMTVLELAACNIPQVLVNARMSDRSFNRWTKAIKLAEALYDNFSHVVAQSDVDAERFRRLGARPVTVSGNLKVDTEPLPVLQNKLDAFRRQVGKRPVFVAASTHPGEDETIVGVHQSVSKRIANLLTVIIPRHPDRGAGIIKMLRDRGASAALRSAGEPVTAKTGIYVADTIGEMGLFLRLGMVVFMGKSLNASGGQNPLEPAVLGVPVLSGPNVINFRDAFQGLLDAGGAKLVRDETMLGENVEHLLVNPAEREQMADAAMKAVENMRGAMDRTINALDPYVYPLTIKRGLEGIT